MEMGRRGSTADDGSAKFTCTVLPYDFPSTYYEPSSRSSTASGRTQRYFESDVSEGRFLATKSPVPESLSAAKSTTSSLQSHQLHVIFPDVEVVYVLEDLDFTSIGIAGMVQNDKTWTCKIENMGGHLR